jgi:hypothetical protein
MSRHGRSEDSAHGVARTHLVEEENRVVEARHVGHLGLLEVDAGRDGLPQPMIRGEVAQIQEEAGLACGVE